MSVSSPLENLAFTLEEYISKLGALGVWVTIDIPGRPRSHVVAGRRRIDSNEPIRANDLFQIASQTKTLVAMAMLLLQRHGKLSLDDHVVGLIDLEIDSRITIRHLIMNTCGLGEYTHYLYSADTDHRVLLTPRELFSQAKPLGQPLVPGAAFDYCNTGWLVAALVIDALVPEGFTGFIRKHIFEPLGLRDSYLWGEDLPMDRLARGYLKTAHLAIPIDSGETGLDWAYGAGNAISTQDDMIDLYRALLAPANPIGLTLQDLTHEVAKPNARPLFALSLGAEYAYGLERRAWGGRPLWGHPGKAVGTYSSTWADPGNGIVVATAYTNVWDTTEASELTSIRYNAPQLFTQAIMTAYALAKI
jgi:D-alanyl-D-alanine carboxypeptidase